MTDLERTELAECVKLAIERGLITVPQPKTNRTQDEIKAIKRERRKLRHIRVIYRGRCKCGRPMRHPGRCQTATFARIDPTRILMSRDFTCV